MVAVRGEIWFDIGLELREHNSGPGIEVRHFLSDTYRLGSSIQVTLVIVIQQEVKPQLPPAHHCFLSL